MKFIHLLLFICLVCSNIHAQEEVEELEILGLAYNLFAVKAQKLDQSKPFGHCRVPGGILLDPRKSYSSTFEKDEYYSDGAKILKENEVFQLPGYFRMSKIYRSDIKDYFIATKVANQWTNHTFDEILEYEFISQGDEIGCPQCNFHKVYYNDRDNCAVSVFYQIFPLRTRDALEFQESITGQNDGLENTETLVVEIESKEVKQKERKEVEIKVKPEKALTQTTQVVNYPATTATKKKKYAKYPASKLAKSSLDRTKTASTKSATPKEVKFRKDFFGNEIPQCDRCAELKKIADDLPNNKYCDALAKDIQRIEYYQCHIKCLEMDGEDQNPVRLTKAKAALKRYQSNVKIRGKRCS